MMDCILLAVALVALAIIMIDVGEKLYGDLFEDNKPTEFESDVQALRVAENQFDYADEEYIDSATYHLAYLEHKLDAAIKNARLLEQTDTPETGITK